MLQRAHRRLQRGAVAVIAALALPIMIGFVGLALDGGRLYLQKTELQNAADACALAASRELTCDASAGPCAASFLINAENAGLTVAGKNRIDFQGSLIGGAQLAAADIEFSPTFGPDGGYLSRAAGASTASKYVRCKPHQNGILPWFMQVLGVGAHAINAQAVATLSPAMTNCAIPVGMCKIPGASSDPHAGLTVGQWVVSKTSASATGSFGWIDFTPPGGGANELAGLFTGTGACSVPAPPTLVGEQGNKASLAAAWNTRFGVYKNGGETQATAAPDYTGIAYTEATWPSKFNAYAGAGPSVNFTTARSTYLKYTQIMPVSNVNTGINFNGSYAIPSNTNHQQYGADRRLVTAPIVDCTNWAGGGSQQVPVLGYACMLMLAPMGQDSDDVYMEYRGKSTDLTSPCATSGVVGGPAAIGPLVPALVQ